MTEVQTKAMDPPDLPVEQFRIAISRLMESGSSGPDLVEAACALFRAHLQGHREREAALRRDVSAALADGQYKGHMLAHVSASVGRQVQVSAELAADLERYRDRETTLRTLLEDLEDDAAERVRTVLDSAPPAGGRPSRPVFLAFVPDQRWRTGWFYRPDVGGGQIAFPFAGWALAADTVRAVGQQPEACWLLNGRALSTSQLQAMGYMLETYE